MTRAAMSGLALACLVAVGLLASCTVLDPKTGRDRGVEAGAEDRSDYAAPPADGGVDPRCTPDAGLDESKCEGCETAHCCATRFDCYDDPGCKGADEALDECLASAADAGTATVCWQSFSASSVKAEARVACEDRNCKAACGVP
ncbi:MAG: hypothetical protein JWM74_798 [Myxococcaceae bacterium]|nr:hypothetical protein [Myxococcaceae bacterium]